MKSPVGKEIIANTVLVQEYFMCQTFTFFNAINSAVDENKQE